MSDDAGGRPSLSELMARISDEANGTSKSILDSTEIAMFGLIHLTRDYFADGDVILQAGWTVGFPAVYVEKSRRSVRHSWCVVCWSWRERQWEQISVGTYWKLREQLDGDAGVPLVDHPTRDGHTVHDLDPSEESGANLWVDEVS